MNAKNTDPPTAKPEKEYWLDEPKNGKRIVYGLFAVCALLLLADAFPYKHAHFEIENWFGFYAFFGFLVYVGLVMSAKLLRRAIGREEDYYDE